MTDRNGMTLRCISLILVLLLVQLSCLWADGQTLTETYREPTGFKINWSITNSEVSTWVLSEYDDETVRINNNTVTLDSSDTDYQPVCKLTYTTNKVGTHEFYCKAYPFVTEIDGQSYYSGYTLKFSYNDTTDDSYEYTVSPIASAGNPVFFYLPIVIMLDQLDNGIASQIMYIAAKLSDMDSMLPGTNTAQITFVKVVE